MLPILLRVLLSISLILNGSGYAIASVQMQMTHAGKQASASRPAAASKAAAVKPPCHGQADDSMSATAAQSPHDTPDPVPPKPPLPDCCKSGACNGACMQLAQGVIPVQALPHARLARTDSVRRQKPGHAAPALPHLIRPPIG